MPVWWGFLLYALFLKADRLYLPHHMDNKAFGLYGGAAQLVETAIGMVVLVVNTLVPRIIYRDDGGKLDHRVCGFFCRGGAWLWWRFAICIGPDASVWREVCCWWTGARLWDLADIAGSDRDFVDGHAHQARRVSWCTREMDACSGFAVWAVDCDLLGDRSLGSIDCLCHRLLASTCGVGISSIDRGRSKKVR